MHDSKFSGAPSWNIRIAQAKHLSYNAQNFTVDAIPTRLVSGSVHYFRMLPSRWRPVLIYARAMGLNTIETYVPWNLHEPTQGRFRFSGMLDLRQFLEIAHEVGLMVLLRPGPYICSEWDLGGLPPYLLADETMSLRSMHPGYLRAVMRYIDAVHVQIAPYIGKPIVGLQLENEYGAYGKDKIYMHTIKRAWEHKGLTTSHVMFFTSDNGGPHALENGSPFNSSDVLKTINLESNVRKKINMLRILQPNAPAMIGEFWSGWFDHWGGRHHRRPGDEVVREAHIALAIDGANINLYMFFGGTNFGFMAGALTDSKHVYLADTTSYDYDGFITEYGSIREEKFLPMRKMLQRFWRDLGESDYFEATLRQLPTAPAMSAYSGMVPLNNSVGLFDVLDVVREERVYSRFPIPMERIGGDFGFVLYRHNITQGAGRNSSTRTLQIRGVRDLAYVLIDGQVTKIIDRNDELSRAGKVRGRIAIPADARHLDILVENRGRVNYGHYIHDRKGLLGNVTIDFKVIQKFECITMSFRQDHKFLRDVDGRKTIEQIISRMSGKKEHPALRDKKSPPTFFRGELSIEHGTLDKFDGELPGTFCRVMGRGVLWVNGFNVGRFYSGAHGPQYALYVPGELLQEGENEILVFHVNMDITETTARVHFSAHPDYGAPPDIRNE